MSSEISFRPLTTENWDDLETLFGDRGAREGCWCMRWRMPRADFERSKGDRNKQIMRNGVEQGRIHGILGYLDEQPVAWCSLGPREQFYALAQSELLAPVDATPVWSIVCFFVTKHQRLKHLTVALLEAAVDYAGGQGAQMVEGYPLVPIKDRIPVAFAWTGFESTFKKAGFTEVERRGPIRPIMRRTTKSKSH